MDNIAGIPYSIAKFDNDGKLLSNPTIPDETTDIIVVSHGWNNTQADAEELYTKLFTNFALVTKDDEEIQKLKIALVGVIWPSHKFDELMSEPPGKKSPAGGAQSADDNADPAVAQAAMHAMIDRAAPIFDTAAAKVQIDKLHSLVPKLETDAKAQSSFVQTLRELLGGSNQNADQIHSEDASNVFFEGNPQNIFDNVKMAAPASSSEPENTAGSSSQGGSQQRDVIGRAAGLFDVVSKAANAVTSLLNHTTYFEMKKRAGTVGANGVAPLIDKLSKGPKVKNIHLVGHSFGGRVVSATAANSTTDKLCSMSLLQAAFSHNGFSKTRNGFFRSVIDKKRVRGATLITYSKFDRAVGLAYPAASRISGDKSASFGGANDDFGGMGSSGAQNMGHDEVSQGAAKMLDTHLPYTLEAGKIHNLLSDAFIVDPAGGDAHGWVFVPQVAWAISRAVLSCSR